jgi:hypothetical protein
MLVIGGKSSVHLLWQKLRAAAFFKPADSGPVPAQQQIDGFHTHHDLLILV